MGAREFQQAQSKTESKVGASQATLQAPVTVQGSQVPTLPTISSACSCLHGPSQLLPSRGWEGRGHTFLKKNLFLLTISNLCDFQESFPKLSSHEEMKLVTLLGKSESVKVQPQ